MNTTQLIRWAVVPIMIACGVGLTTAASSCDMVCVSDIKPKRVFKAAPAVFIARVVELEPGVEAVLEVEEVYKGAVGPAVVVSSGWGADCRYGFVADGRYIFFSAPDASGRVRQPDTCAEPQPLVDASDSFIKWVRKHKRVPIQSAPVGKRR
jgi:hypothetical protein